MLDAVIRTVFYKYFDPKEALISNGVLNRAIAVATGKSTSKSVDESKTDQYALLYFDRFSCLLQGALVRVPVRGNAESQPECSGDLVQRIGLLSALPPDLRVPLDCG